MLDAPGKFVCRKKRSVTMLSAASAYEQVYQVVRLIPPGRVLTYGLVSHLIAGRLSAAGVGWALGALAPAGAGRGIQAVPWHRVINARGGISTGKNPDIPPGLQRLLLEKEGVLFDEKEQIDLKRYLWHEGITGLSI